MFIAKLHLKKWHYMHTYVFCIVTLGDTYSTCPSLQSSVWNALTGAVECFQISYSKWNKNKTEHPFSLKGYAIIDRIFNETIFETAKNEHAEGQIDDILLQLFELLEKGATICYCSNFSYIMFIAAMKTINHLLLFMTNVDNNSNDDKKSNCKKAAS